MLHSKPTKIKRLLSDMKDAKELLPKKDNSLFVFEGKNDYLLIGLLFLLLALLLSASLIFSH